MSNEVGDYYLVLSRLMPYKRIDLAIEACKRTNRRLVVIGDGPDRARLESDLGKTRTALDIAGKAFALLEGISGSADSDAS